jgi:hypothetical protein
VIVETRACALARRAAIRDHWKRESTGGSIG